MIKYVYVGGREGGGGQLIVGSCQFNVRPTN